MRRGIIGIIIVVIIAIAGALASCAPQAPPAPKPTATTQAPTTSGAPTAPAPQSDWDKTVQAAKKEGKVNFYNWYFTEGRGLQPLTDGFQKKYGIELSSIQGRGAEFLERLKTERRMGQMVGDVVEGSSIHLENMRLATLLKPMLDLPAVQEKNVWALVPNYHNKEGYYLNYQRMLFPLLVNINLVKPADEPKGLMDLLDPKWKGKIIIPDPNLSESPSRFLLYVQQKRLPDDYPVRIGKQDLRFDTSTPAVALRVAQGDVPVGFFAATLDIASIMAEGAPMKILDVKEGTMVDALSMGALEGSPHPNAAKVFLNYILSDEGQRLIANSAFSFPVRSGITPNVPKGMLLEPSNPMPIDPAAVQFSSKAFADKTIVPALKPPK